jgi:hypothetical protein
MEVEGLELSEANVDTMPVKDVVREYRKIRAALSRPHVDGWFGFSSGIMSQIDARQNQLKDRMVKEFLKR